MTAREQSARIARLRDIAAELCPADVEHVVGLAQRYRENRALDMLHAKERRAAAKALEDHAQGLVAWLERAGGTSNMVGLHAAEKYAPEYEVWLDVRGAATLERGAQPLPANPIDYAEPLQALLRAVPAACNEIRDKRPQIAPRIAAGAVCALLGTKAKAYVGGPAVHLLQAIARAAGDNSLTAEATRKLIGKALQERHTKG